MSALLALRCLMKSAAFEEQQIHHMGGRVRADIQPEHHTHATVQQVDAGQRVQVMEQTAISQGYQNQSPQYRGVTSAPAPLHVETARD